MVPNETTLHQKPNDLEVTNHIGHFNNEPNRYQGVEFKLFCVLDSRTIELKSTGLAANLLVGLN